MRKAKQKSNQNMRNSVDYYNFCTVDNRLPILEIINERFVCCFRVSIYNYLRLISTIDHSLHNQKFSEWVEQNNNDCCSFIIRLGSLMAPILVKFDRSLSYGIIDALAGGNGKEYKQKVEKEFTQIELALLKDIADLVITELNEAWKPVEEIKA